MAARQLERDERRHGVEVWLADATWIDVAGSPEGVLHSSAMYFGSHSIDGLLDKAAQNIPSKPDRKRYVRKRRRLGPARCTDLS